MQPWLKPANLLIGKFKGYRSINSSLNYSLNRLRSSNLRGELSDVTHFRGGAVLRADPEMELSGKFQSPEGRLLELDVSMSCPGSWVGLHLPLRQTSFSGFGALGFVCRGYALDLCTLRVCLRSHFTENFADSFFHKHVLLHQSDAMHVDAISLQNRQHVPETCKKRELIVFLPSSPFSLSILDFRVFAV